MKLRELEANTEYAQIKRLGFADKVRIKPDQLERGLSKRYGYRGQLEVEVWEMGWDRERSWKTRLVPISQIKMPWADWEEQETKRKLEWETEVKRNAEIRKENEAKQEELFAYLRTNKDRLIAQGLIKSTRHVSFYDLKGGTLALYLTKDQLETILTKLEKGIN